MPIIKMQNKKPAKQEEEEKFEGYLAVLEEHRKNSEREGNFAEAQNAKLRIEEMRIQEG